MASTIGPSPPSDHLSLESIPTVDLRLLSQSELNALSLCSSHAFDLRRCDDVVIPKIDRSVFNESAGSRKQTYSRLRLAPRNPNNGGNTPKPRNPTISPLEADNSKIISLFKALFNGEDFTNGDADVSLSSALVPVNVEYTDAFLGGVDGGEKKRKRGRKMKCETVTTAATTTTTTLAITTVPTTVELQVEVEDEEAKKRNEEEKKRKEEERERELVNKNGDVVDLVELGKKEDPFGEEIKKRTEGKEDPEDLLGFIGDLNGQWGSRRKKRKIVDANEFGDALPIGWKVLIAMKKKQGHAWVFCRRYISPNGRYFVSCKEVASYLLSLTSPEDLKPQTAVQCLEDSVVENKFLSENGTDPGSKIEHPSLCATPQSNDYKILQKPLLTSTSQSIDQDKQLTLFTNNQSGDVHATSALKCHKCSTAFGEKDELLNHLVSCHKRKRRKSGAPIEDDIIMKDGKYECQFCNKVFHERSSYFGHVGIHVKNYVKSIGGSPGLTGTSKRKVPATVPAAEVPPTISVGEVPVAVSVDKVPLMDSVDEVPVSVSVDKVSVIVSETLRDVEVNDVSIASASNTLASSEPNSNSAESKPYAGCEAEIHLRHGKVDQNHASLHAELVNGAEKNKEMSADESSGKHDGTPHTTDNNMREVEEAVDFSAMKPDSVSDSEVYFSNNNDLSESLGIINAAECLDSKISRSSAELVEDDSDSKQMHLGNGDYFTANTQREKVASESILCAENKENSSGNHNSENQSLGNISVKHSSFTEGLELGYADGLIDHSDNSHLDLGINAASDVPHPGSLDECSDVLDKEEEVCDTTANRTELMESSLMVSNGNCTEENGIENYVGKDFVGMVSGTEVSMCSLDDTEAIVDAEERAESCLDLPSKGNGCGYIVNEAETSPHIEMVEPRETGAFQVEQTCSLGRFPRELSNRNVEEPKSKQAVNSNNLFFTSGSNGLPLAANVLTNNDQAHSDAPNVLGAFNNFVEDKQEQIPKSLLSSLSINEHMREVAMNNVTDVPSTTTSMQLPEINKVDGSRSNKLIFDFDNISEINARFLGSVQNAAVPNETPPFPLWGQQTCAIEDNQTRIYDGSRGVAQQERASGNTPLDVVGFQRPSDVGYNLNEVCMNERRYGVQHNENRVYGKNNEVRREGVFSGARGIVQQERTDNNSLNLVGLQQPTHADFNLNKVHMNEQSYGVQVNESGVYNESNDSRREMISHGNSLNLAVHQQQCDAGYNLNKPCINQQNYGMLCNETGAYSTSNESKQDRVTYGNSLSLASVPQPCDTYSLNKSCIQQTCDSGFSLDKGYMGTMQGLSKFDELGHTRDQDLMIGFRNSDRRPNQGVATEFLWRSTEGNVLPGGLMDSSSSQGQSSSSYQAFDFLSDKGGNDLYAANEKFDNISSFEGLRSNNVEPMEFSFMTAQDSNAQLDHQKVLSFDAQMDQGFGSSVWQQKSSLPNMMTGHVVTTMCVWCGNEFHQDSLGCEMQAGSIGYLCPTCKARMAGQYL